MLKNYYEENYKNYDLQNPPHKLDFYISRCLKYLKYKSDKTEYRILDIGCAFGAFLSKLPSNFTRFGSDINDHAINTLLKNQNSIVAKEGGAGDILFTEKFDIITAFDVLEHVEDIDVITRVVSDQLKDGGLFVFVVPVYDGLSGPFIKVLDKDPTHIHKWPRGHWLNWISDNFDLMEWRGIFRYLLLGKYYIHIPTKLFRSNTPAICVVCKKKTL